MKRDVADFLFDRVESFDLLTWINVFSALSKAPNATVEQIAELLSRQTSVGGKGMVFEDAVAADGIAVKMMYANKGEGFKNHAHDYNHITLVASGSVIFHRGGGEHKQFGVGVVVTEKNIEHEYIAAEDGTVLACIHLVEQLDERGQKYLLVEDKHLIGDWKNAK